MTRELSAVGIDRAQGGDPAAALDPLAGIADLDHDRVLRRGYPEAVYTESKSAGQLRAIAIALSERQEPVTTLFTRADPERAAVIHSVLPDAFYDSEARLLAWPPERPDPSGGHVVVACAGTSDLPIAREAALTAEYLGRRVTLLADVGVAGLHRILKHMDLLRSAAAVVVVAGMDGALPSVVAGQVSAPVVACPTSVGYGAAFGGLAPLLTMLNACAPGVGVVNIDNGYGAGHLAAQIAAPRQVSRQGE
ncbi:MAG TPA: nickel pincer cofactor biosynthesis protein LarB [Actinomycetaceae bacterium]|nr:nickel pincer cofactor biosynthesis protein LarB [Actinomycetaceae bacterium]